MKKRRLDPQLATTSIALFFITLSFCFIDKLQPGYSQYLHHLDWYSESSETSRTEERREDDDHALLVLNPVEQSAHLYKEKRQTSLHFVIGSAKQFSGWHRPAKSWPVKTRKAIVRSWYQIALKTSSLPVAIVHFSVTRNRIGGWKDTNVMYRALNGYPA